SCYTRTTPVGDVTWFSGVGPTADGRIKPDILAPGGGILSAFSSDVPASSYTEDELNNLRTPNELYWIRRGTSMATPHVAGTVALLLEQFPNLTFDQMVGRLQSRGLHRVDQRTGAAVVELRSGEALTPLTELFLGDVRLEADGVEIRWNVLKEFAQTEYQVFRGFSPEGPFHRIATAEEGQPREYSVLDQYLEPGRTHYYKVLATDAFGLEEELGVMEIVVPGVAQSVLRAPRPNPAQGPVQLQFFLAPHETSGTYRLEVFDLQGRRVRELGSSHRPAAGLETTETWDLRGESGLPVSAGVYWVRLLQEDESGASIRSPMTTRLLVLPS
ncbi:MAG: S8 family serine peptidase, partial [Candidatus Eisenbacteria bacterium]|nr:S8 family serine peptidase [Candidatus Eisenbacteria bacterium]